MRAHAAALIVLWLLAFVVRVDATAARTSAGHGDVAAYHQVAQHLHEGRGFEQDFVADRLAGPTALPTPSNTWWRPLPSVIGWLGMRAADDPSYTAGKRAMLVLSACVPWVAYLAGWLLLGTRVGALAAGLLAVGFHLYLDQPNHLLAHGPYALFGSGALLVALALERTTRPVPAFGVLFGLAYLSRGDAQVLPLVLVAALAARRLCDGRPVPWRALAAAAGLFVLVVAPWWGRNLRVYGATMPPGLSRVAFATSYEEWFAEPDSLTWEHYRAWGWDNILAQKRDSVADAAAFLPLYASESVDHGRAAPPGSPVRRLHVLGRWVLNPLSWIGFAWLLVRRRRAALLVLLQIALLIGVYSVLFPAVGRNSFHSGLFSVYPVVLVGVVAALGLALRLLLGPRERARQVATVALAGVLCALNVWGARPYLADKYAGVETMLAPYRRLGEWIDAEGLERPVFYCRNPWQLSTETRAGAVMLPLGEAEELRRVAQTFGVTHLVDELHSRETLLQLRPGLAALLDSGELERVEAPLEFHVYRLKRGL
ncbi:MAG TPA: hypothetical protein VMT18_06460 [Planctomycetota bacterium]|nr:hypothetical protein [Planctomycetota bacterium]